ncbi:ketoacyl-ACP synthase III family protein [Streptomyces sp. ISL-98]|uniref:ketoacyl-ACP synthase III family protein n=1 Tax=Streptomyces sp. ISL-98 TaxID=2819192 RepID=UPI001BE6AAD2|nr:ketoacyl-ACP synthase III family protein [Streptomyces sp. ISL-98]MBT2507487.1 ketoacyl-ACP synthase III family protein [Streptomyces sp. ISL-98]
MKVDNIYLAGIGTYVPRTVPVREAARQGWIDSTAAKESGITAVAVETELAAVDMAVDAATKAVERSGHRPEDFAALLHSGAYYQGPEGWSAPHYVLHRTLNQPVVATEIRHGCLSVLTSLRLAAGLLGTTPGKEAVLITAADNFSTPLVDRWRDSDHAMYADSAAALVASTRSGFARLLAVGSRSESSLEAMHRGAEPLLPPARHPDRPMYVAPRLEAWSQRPGAAPLDMIAAVKRFGDLVAETAEQTLAEAGVGWDSITRVAHIGFNEDALHAMILDPLEVSAEVGTWEYIRTIGHASVSDLVLGLQHLWETGQVTEGDHVLLVGATEGMEAGCAVVQITAPPAAHG